MFYVQQEVHHFFKFESVAQFLKCKIKLLS